MDVENGRTSGRKDAGAAVDLDWQSFPSGEASGAGAGAAPSPLAEPVAGAASKDGTASPGGSALLQLREASSSPLACFSPAFYYESFDVTSKEVVDRLKAALWPLGRTSFLSTIAGKPDLYGPVWTAATLVFVIGAGGNLASWLSFKPGQEALTSIWHYDFQLVISAFFAVYAFCFGVAGALWVALNWFGLVSSIPLIYWLCISGYSLAPFIPAGLLSVIPSTGLQWFVAVVGAAFSALFWFKSLFPVLASGATAGATAAAAQVPLSAHFSSVGMKVAVPAVIVVQLGFAALLKLKFFTF